ncbi:hypothetical protein HDV02_001523 [Globomyces sp. JEL0801]|nr:hypothetical protein HDV02_001523 [Globomyces sp. JEL0801]
MSPAILRAEITNDSNNLISNHNENTDRRIIRQLIPRQPEKDVVVTQELIVSSSDNQMSVQHRAINHNNETSLISLERPIYPMEEKLEDVDWIIGNHPDELTLWIPIMASISKTKFMIIPCCLHELSGQKFTKLDVNLGRYMTYCKAIEKLSTNLGFQIEWEHLRIPSTKNICLFSRNQTIVDGIDSIIDDLTKTVHFNLRKTDRQKTLEYLSKREMKLNKQNV